MTKTNWKDADAFQRGLPHTFAAMQKFVMAMAKAKKNQGKTAWFGRDKGLAAFKEFEDQIKNLYRAMLLDGILGDAKSPNDVRGVILSTLAVWSEIYPNWQDAYIFAKEFFVDMPSAANDLIAGAMKTR